MLKLLVYLIQFIYYLYLYKLNTLLINTSINLHLKHFKVIGRNNINLSFKKNEWIKSI